MVRLPLHATLIRYQAVEVLPTGSDRRPLHRHIRHERIVKQADTQYQRNTLIAIAAVVSLCSTGMCTTEGNVGTIAATGTNPHTATTGRTICDKRFCRHYSEQQAVLDRRYRKAHTVVVCRREVFYVDGAILKPCIGVSSTPCTALCLSKMLGNHITPLR